MRKTLVLLGWLVSVAMSCARGNSANFDTASGGAGGGEGGAGGGAGTGGVAVGGSGGTGSGGTNPCDGVTCNMPPLNICADTNNITVFAPAGACNAGECIHASSTMPCPNGCVNNACNGDPCIGVSCLLPPANYCSDTTHVVIYETPGTCGNGTCSYATHMEFCANGCINGVCNGDPCIGVSCNVPPANYCSAANDLTVYETPGTCTNGTCTYKNHKEFCNFGCVNGSCSGDSCVGLTCMTPPAAFCSAPNTLTTYSASGTCTNGICTYSPMNQACANGCLNGACVQCAMQADCPMGQWCNNATCVSCNDDQHCGTTCAACNTPMPKCLNQGGTSTCVACLMNADCTAPSICSGNACVAGCMLPADACSTGTQDRKGCANARIIGRSAASAAGGTSMSPTTCSASNLMDVSGCSDAGNDHSYRLFMRQGETMTLTLSTGAECLGGTWFATLKIYTNGGCTDTQCTTSVLCDANKSNTTKSYVAPKDGWYIMVVDGASSSDKGTYSLNIKLTCNAGTCEC